MKHVINLIGCLLIEVRDHRPLATSSSVSSNTSHPNNHNEHITPSPRIPTNSQNNSLPASNQAPSSVAASDSRVYRTLLRPNEESLWAELCVLSEAAGPADKEGNRKFEDETAIRMEAEILGALNPSLILDPITFPESLAKVFERSLPPGTLPPYTRKREATNN